MMLRAAGCCLALILGLLLSLYVTAAPAAAAPGKPLDIKKFMREQAASTRAAAPKVKKPARAATRHAVAAKPHKAKSVRAAKPLPADVTAYAPAPPDVEVVPDDAFNAIDQAAGPAQNAVAETVGSGLPAPTPVQVVIADEFNEIDRMAAERPRPEMQVPCDADPSG